MSDNNKSKKTATAIIWAGVILATALILRDSGVEKSGSILMLFIIGWFVSDGINNGKNTLGEEVACAQSFFNKGDNNKDKE